MGQFSITFITVLSWPSVLLWTVLSVSASDSSQIMSLHERYISFLWQVADLGCNLNMPLLRDGARILMKLMPPGALNASLDGCLTCLAVPINLFYSLLNVVIFQIMPQWKTFELSVWIMPNLVKTALVPRWTHASLGRHHLKCFTW